MKYDETVIQKYYEAIKLDVLNMERIYEELQDELKNPLDIFTYEMFLEAVKQFGVHISLLPYEYFTPEICLEAIKPDTVRHKIYNELINKGSAIRWIPEEFITEEWCYIGAKAKNHYIMSNILNKIPEKFRTERVCIESVKRDGHEFFFVPETLKTKELCLTAIKAIWAVYKDIMDQIPAAYWKDKDFCVQAVKQNPWVIKRVPDKIRTMEFCLDAVKYDGRCLKNIPKKQKTEEVCFFAVKNTWEASQYVPEELRKKVFGL